MAAFVKSVERISGSFTGSGTSQLTQVINLTKGQDFSQCACLGQTMDYSFRPSQRTINQALAVEFFDNAGTPAARIIRNGAFNWGTMEYEFSIVEFASSVTVQQGSVAVTGFSETATISSVNQDHSFILFTRAGIFGTSDYQFDFFKASFNSDTEIEFERGRSSPDWDIYYYVITSNGTDFQTERADFSTTSNSNTERKHTLSNSAPLDNSFLVCTYETGFPSRQMRDMVWSFALTSPTEITAYRNHGAIPNSSGDFGVWVVRSDSTGLSTQSLATDVESSVTTDETITSVDLDKAAILAKANLGMAVNPINAALNSANDVIDQFHSIRLTSATNVRLERNAGTPLGVNNFIRYDVIEFELESAGPDPQIVPVGVVEETDSVIAVTPVAGPVSVAVDLITETDSVLAVTPITGGEPQTVPVGLISEVDSVLAVTPVAGEVSVPVGIVSETDSVLPVTPVPGEAAVSVGTVSETDQIAPVFPVLEGGPQTVLVVNVAERDFVFPVTPRLPSEEVPGGIPTKPRKPIRKKRRYILPDNRVYTDPERALYELRALLKKEQEAPTESGGDLALSQPTPASRGQEGLLPDTPSEEPVAPEMLQSALSELPELLLARPEAVPSLDPQLISVLFQMIDDEEAAILLL